MKKQNSAKAVSAGVAIIFGILGGAISLGASSLDLDDIFLFGEFWPEDGELAIYFFAILSGAAGWFVSYPLLKNKVFLDEKTDAEE